MPNEINELLVKLSSMKISTCYTDYTKLVEFSSKCGNKAKIFSLIMKNSDTLPSTLSLLHTFTSKLEEADASLFMQILNFIHSIEAATTEESEWILKILFLMMERTGKKARCQLLILENLRKHFIKQSVISHTISLMHNPNMADMALEVLNFLPEICEEFARAVIAQKSTSVLKNASAIIPVLVEKHGSKFSNIKIFEIFMDSDQVFLRTCFLEILISWCRYSRSDEVYKLAKSHLLERLQDQHYVVRSRAISLISQMIEEGMISNDFRTEVLLSIIDRIKDKAVIVRKKAIGICCKAISNHPFIYSDTLQKIDLSKIRDEKENLENVRESSAQMIEYYTELNDFHDIMSQALGNVVEVLDFDIKSDVLDCIEYIKMAYLFKIQEAGQALQKVFDLVWTQDANVIYESIRDLILKIKAKYKSTSNRQTYLFLKEFIDKKQNFSLDKILSEMSRRKYMDPGFCGELCTVFSTKKDLYGVSYILSHITQYRPLLADNYYEILEIATSVLFSSGNTETLKTNLAVYKNILSIKLRKPYSANVEKLITKNLAKMNFFDYQITDLTVNLLYKVSDNIEASCSNLLDLLSTKNSNMLKLIQAVGTIALRHYKYIESLEKAVKSKKIDMNIENLALPSDIRAKRKSLNAGRASISSRAQDGDDQGATPNTDGADSKREFDNLDFADENDKLSANESFKTSNDSIIGDQSIVDASQLNIHLSAKTEEEIADFFFYIKENEMLFGENSLLRPFKDIVSTNCHSEDENLQNTSYLALFKLMCTSSEFFHQSYPLFVGSFYHRNYKVRANAVIAMSDFLLSYNTLVEQDTHLLFNALSDKNTVVKKNALFVVYNLLQKNILKIKGYSVKLTELILDHELYSEAQNVLRNISSRENIISIIFYEAITSPTTCQADVIAFLCNLVSEKAREALFIKILRAGVPQEMCNLVFDKFCLSEKFIAEISHYEEYKRVFPVAMK